MGVACCSGGRYGHDTHRRSAHNLTLKYRRDVLRWGDSNVYGQSHVGHGKCTGDLPVRFCALLINRGHKILFLLGLTLIIGPQKTAVFFARRQKWKGTAGFVTGIVLILLRWPLIGFLIELYGILILFGDFFATIGGFAGNIPVVGTYIQQALNRAGGGRRNAELPV